MENIKKGKIDIDRYRVKENEKVNLKKFPTNIQLTKKAEKHSYREYGKIFTGKLTVLLTNGSSFP